LRFSTNRELFGGGFGPAAGQIDLAETESRLGILRLKFLGGLVGAGDADLILSGETHGA
jgi:hypothetical protein